MTYEDEPEYSTIDICPCAGPGRLVRSQGEVITVPPWCSEHNPKSKQ